jgi:hypothetical protein
MSNPQTWDRYAYVGNSPLNWIDPSGLVAERKQDGCLGCGGSWTAHNSSNGQNSKGQWNQPTGTKLIRRNSSGATESSVFLPGVLFSMHLNVGFDSTMESSDFEIQKKFFFEDFFTMANAMKDAVHFSADIGDVAVNKSESGYAIGPASFFEADAINIVVTNSLPPGTLAPAVNLNNNGSRVVVYDAVRSRYQSPVGNAGPINLFQEITTAAGRSDASYRYGPIRAFFADAWANLKSRWRYGTGSLPSSWYESASNFRGSP